MLEPFENDLRRCAGCHDQCLFATAEVFATGRQTLATSRKALLLLAASHGELSWSAALADVAYAGLGSGIQHSVCVHRGDPSGWPDESEYLRAARVELVREGFAPAWAVAMRDRWRSAGDPYGDSGEERAVPGEVVFVSDAATRAFQRDTPSEWLSVAGELGVAAGSLGTGSSGFELAELGFIDEAREAAADLRARLAGLRPRLIVSDAPETVHTIARWWPEWGVDSPAPIQHTSEWLADRLCAAGTKRRSSGPLLTFQDPSFLARYLGVVDAPRDALGRMGVRLAEMWRSGIDASPTGSFFGEHVGGWVREVATDRASSARISGAEGIVTASPFDYRNLNGAYAVIDLGCLALERLESSRGRAVRRHARARSQS